MLPSTPGPRHIRPYLRNYSAEIKIALHGLPLRSLSPFSEGVFQMLMSVFTQIRFIRLPRSRIRREAADVCVSAPAPSTQPPSRPLVPKSRPGCNYPLLYLER